MPPRRAALIAVGAVLALLSACTSWNPGTNPLTNQSHLIDDLVNRLQNRLAEPGAQGYSATYQLAGAGVGQIAQLADRAAYRYPGGDVLMAADRTTTCTIPAKGKPACVHTDPPITVAPLLAAATRAGFIAAPTLIVLLTTAAEHPAWLAGQSDSTIAGRPATCITITQTETSSSYTTCVTVDGAVGSFTGTADGIKIDCYLTDYRDAVSLDAFSPPAGATFTDRRTRSP